MPALWKVSVIVKSKFQNLVYSRVSIYFSKFTLFFECEFKYLQSGPTISANPFDLKSSGVHSFKGEGNGKLIKRQVGSFSSSISGTSVLKNLVVLG